MRISSQLLLTFLLNACWQIALIAALAAIGSRLLRNSVARYQHWLWVSALCLAFLVPAITSSRMLLDSVQPISTTTVTFPRETIPLPETTQELSPPTFAAPSSTFQLNQILALALLAIYCGFLLYRSFKLVQAWHTTRSIKLSSDWLAPHHLYVVSQLLQP